MRVWVGIETPAPSSIQRVTPNEIRVFATREAAQDWWRDLRVTATSPLRETFEREVEK